MKPTIDSVEAIAKRGHTDERKTAPTWRPANTEARFASGSLSTDSKASKKQKT